MTGYGESTLLKDQYQIAVSLRTVNGRYLEIRTHLPKEYFSLEADLKKFIQKKFVRSSVDLFVTRKVMPTKENYKISIQKDLAKQVYGVCNDLKKVLKLKDNVGISTLLRWPEIFAVEEKKDLLQDEKKDLFKLVQDTLDLCDEQRLREGKSVREDLQKNLLHLKDLVEQMAKLAVFQPQEIKDNLLQRWQKLKGPAGVDEQRVAQEVVIFVDKCDISEEISRLKEHITNCLNLVKGSEAQGKKLEFYSQELLREVNTIGSKSQKSALTQMVVEAKGSIEKIREQVQNIE